jgi:dTDP-4-amino-4,6-dideoxygalactose transaminase
MFYLKLRDLEDRTAFISHMKERGVQCVFHYVPLHSAPAGLKFGEFVGEDRYTTKESERLVRLPMYYGIADEDLETVITSALDYFRRS